MVCRRFCRWIGITCTSSLRNEVLEEKSHETTGSRGQRVARQPVKFSELVAKIRETNVKPLLYLGPRNSGTRSVVNIVLDSANIASDEVEAVGIADFQEMVAALRQGKIDGAFFVTSPEIECRGAGDQGSGLYAGQRRRGEHLANTVSYLEKW